MINTENQPNTSPVQQTLDAIREFRTQKLDQVPDNKIPKPNKTYNGPPNKNTNNGQ